MTSASFQTFLHTIKYSLQKNFHELLIAWRANPCKEHYCSTPSGCVENDNKYSGTHIIGSHRLAEVHCTQPINVSINDYLPLGKTQANLVALYFSLESSLLREAWYDLYFLFPCNLWDDIHFRLQSRATSDSISRRVEEKRGDNSKQRGENKSAVLEYSLFLAIPQSYLRGRLTFKWCMIITCFFNALSWQHGKQEIRLEKPALAFNEETSLKFYALDVSCVVFSFSKVCSVELPRYILDTYAVLKLN